MFGNFVSSLNENKYFYAMAMILFNIGARYIEIDLDEHHKKFLSSTVIRRLLIFTMAFVATRDIIASLIITASFVIIVLNLFNKTSRYCILPKNINELDLNNDGYISPEEIEKAYEILKRSGKI
uniref:EF-hand domain-containing protein n=1 Tax=viral metagenome TaxID=1070528 RepID=A0A6C0B4S0_9ZZZZ